MRGLCEGFGRVGGVRAEWRWCAGSDGVKGRSAGVQARRKTGGREVVTARRVSGREHYHGAGEGGNREGRS